mmetsp:Transcript_16449/g.45581  ORF Transcript_16449/g.45581 Transcript_16449/m.45581 type:complete len:247 (+) Transcript_16449:84-824(+)
MMAEERGVLNLRVNQIRITREHGMMRRRMQWAKLRRPVSPKTERGITLCLRVQEVVTEPFCRQRPKLWRSSYGGSDRSHALSRARLVESRYSGSSGIGRGMPSSAGGGLAGHSSCASGCAPPSRRSMSSRTESLPRTSSLPRASSLPRTSSLSKQKKGDSSAPSELASRTGPPSSCLANTARVEPLLSTASSCGLTHGLPSMSMSMSFADLSTMSVSSGSSGAAAASVSSWFLLSRKKWRNFDLMV